MYKIIRTKFVVPKRYIHKFLLIMRLTTIILLVSLLQVSAKTYSQSVTLDTKKASLTQILDMIRSQTGYDFIYNKQLMKASKPVTIHVENKQLTEVLDECFADQPLTYEIKNKVVLLEAKKEPSLFEKLKSAITAVDIHGKVVDEDGKPLPGATVKEKGGKFAATTTEKGEFALPGLTSNSVVVFSFIGYETQEIPVTQINGFFTVVLKASFTGLKEVVINKGYYSENKELSTGTVGTLKSDDISKQPVTNPLAALAGRIPGVIVTQDNGLPGSTFSVQIRGKGSLINGSEPLYVIDGVPYAAGNSGVNTVTSLLSFNSGTGYSPFSALNPNDIESIDILKDADATAIYGSRGANGVVLITTKKGKAGKTTVSANVYSGYSKVTKLPDLMNTQQYLQMRKEAFANDGVTPDLSNAPDLLVWDQNQYTNWPKKLIGNTAKSTDANVSLAGGNEFTQFLIGTNYHYESVVFPGEFNDNKVAVNFSLNHSSSDHKFNIAFYNVYNTDNNKLPFYLATQGLYLPPNSPSPYDASGKLYWGSATTPYDNPFAYLYSKNTTNTANLLSNVAMSYKLTEKLTFRTTVGYNLMHVDDYSNIPIASQNPFYSNTITGSAQFGNRKVESFNIEPQMEFNTTIAGEKLSALVGGTYNHVKNESNELDLDGYTNDNLLNTTVTGAAPVTSARYNDYSEYKYAALYGRINYNWKDRYILNLTGREDGSSKFGIDKRFNLFGAIGAAWVLSNESFVKENLNFFELLKIKGSYGVTGNDQIQNYAYLNTWKSGYSYEKQNSLVPSSLYNPDYSWERNQKMEVGLDMGFGKGRFFISADYYRTISGNQLVQYTLPYTTGFTSVLQNLPAKIENKGLEFSLSAMVFKGKKFRWIVDANLTLPKNKLLSFANISSSPYASTYFIGQSTNALYKYKTLGVDPSTGLYQFEDLNKNGNISVDADRQISGITNPKFYGGVQNKFSIGRFDLDVFFEFKKQLGLNYIGNTSAPPGFEFNVPAEYSNAWHASGDKATNLKYTANYGDAYGSWSSMHSYGDATYSDASYIRLKNLYFAFNLPEKALKIKKAKIFVQGQNLLTITKYKVSDPETQNYLGIPPLKTIVFGFNVNL